MIISFKKWFTLGVGGRRLRVLGGQSLSCKKEKEENIKVKNLSFFLDLK
jgi:hypothetical protein